MDPTLTQSPTPPADARLVISERIGSSQAAAAASRTSLGHRIKVHHVVVWHERMGMSPTEIVESRPTISLSDVLAALAYYDGHRDEIDADIVAEEKYAAEIEANYDTRSARSSGV